MILILTHFLRCIVFKYNNIISIAFYENIDI